MRLFVAVEAPKEWRAAAMAVQRSLPPDLRRSLRIVEPHLMHVTLRFLGEVPDDQAPALIEALRDRVPPVEVPLALGGPGTFGPPNRTAAVYLHVDGDLGALDALRGRVDEAVRVALGREREERGFTPHLTLGRLGRRATPADRRAVAEGVRALDPPEPVEYVARSVVLVRSHLSSQGARYENIEEFG